MTDDRPRPRYGEYAPLGSAPTPLVDPENSDIPTPGSAIPANPEPSGTLPSESREPGLSPTSSRRRTWDVALTTALMLFGVLDVVGSFSRFGDLAATLRQLYEQQSLGKFTSDALADDMGAAINIARVVLLAAGIAFGLWRLGRGKVAFWVPLAAGALSFVVICVCLLVVVVNDPALAAYVTQQSTKP